MEKRDNTDKENKQENPYHISYENYMDTNADTEVTGLIPRGIPRREDWDAYREIFDFIPVHRLKDDVDE